MSGLFDLFTTSDGGDYEPDFPVDPGAGDSPADSGTLPGSSGGSVIDGWLGTLGNLGGKAIDAYSTYAKLQTQKAAVDTARATAESAQTTARRDAQLTSDRLGFQGQAEKTRAAQSALQAQQGYQAAALFGSPIVLVLIVGGLFLLARR